MIVNDDDGDDDRLGSYSNWIFFAEGGRHILCRNSCHNRYLLRLRKIDINTNDDDDHDSIKRILHSIRYTDIMINNWFGINTFNISNDSPRVIELLPSFKSDLMISINEYRPIGRKSSSNDIHKYGTIDIDYSYLYKPINTNSNIDNNNDISIELKIKCGLKCSSPFLSCTDSNSNSNSNVDTSHDIKLRYSRYGLMQLVKLGKRMTESISNPWENSNANNFKLSSYNPSDLWYQSYYYHYYHYHHHYYYHYHHHHHHHYYHCKLDLKKQTFELQSKINQIQLDRFVKDKKFLEDVNTNLSVIVNELLPNSDCYLSYGDTPVSLFQEGITLLSKQRDGNFRELKALSGGQQSIFCLSLSLSIQQIFPSPFWIMDEIDAALDIIVVSNLAKMIQSKARSTFTQFLVVTHRPEMYSEAESLLGLYLINNAPSHLTINNNVSYHNNTTDFIDDEEKEYYNENI